MPTPPKMAAQPGAAEQPRLVPRPFSRGRLAFFRAVEAAARTLGGRAYYRARHLAPPRLVLREERLLVRGLAPALEGFTLAQWSDLHAGSFLGQGSLTRAIELVNARRPEVHVLTGDFVTHSVDEARVLLADLAKLRSVHGTFAVFGNHDYKARRESEIASAFGSFGVRFLRNECARIEVAPGAAVALVGLEDLEEGRVVDLSAARAEVGPGDVELLLCHNPGAGPRLARAGCVAILSGHTHGTQVDLPFLRKLARGPRGIRAAYGCARQFVRRGRGAGALRGLEVARAEVVLVVLERA